MRYLPAQPRPHQTGMPYYASSLTFLLFSLNVYPPEQETRVVSVEQRYPRGVKFDAPVFLRRAMPSLAPDSGALLSSEMSNDWIPRFDYILTMNSTCIDSNRPS